VGCVSVLGVKWSVNTAFSKVLSGSRERKEKAIYNSKGFAKQTHLDICPFSEQCSPLTVVDVGVMFYFLPKCPQSTCVPKAPRGRISQAVSTAFLENIIIKMKNPYLSKRQ